jgi:hypothetical protein
VSDDRKCSHGNPAGECDREDEPPAEPPPEVDRTARTTLHGTPIGEHLEIQPSGMQKDYIVLTDGLTADERIWLRAFRVSLSAHSMFGKEMSAGQAAFEAEMEVQRSKGARR